MAIRHMWQVANGLDNADLNDERVIFYRYIIKESYLIITAYGHVNVLGAIDGSYPNDGVPT